MNQRLVRATTLNGAVILGLGSILGTGAYISVGLSADIAGSGLILAIILAALTAMCNGLSSAQLAAVHPVSGGTYEYGYQFLNPIFGVVAGGLFIIAKSASAATAALAVAWYISQFIGSSEWLIKAIAVGLLFVFTWFVLSGVKRTNRLNLLLVVTSVFGLLAFMIGAWQSPSQSLPNADVVDPEFDAIVYAAALMFVAFTGYGRIATMSEEVSDPRTTIPKAIIVTLVISSVLYIGVGVAILYLGASDSFTQENFTIANLISESPLAWLVLLSGGVAMAGVVLNLVLGVSRVVLAMGRRGDLPTFTTKLNTKQTSAPAATWFTFAIMAGLALLGDLKLAWGISAFTVLVYYSITNLAALRVPRSQRFIPKWVSVIGLVVCLSLAVFVPPIILVFGIGLIALLALCKVIKS